MIGIINIVLLLVGLLLLAKGADIFVEGAGQLAARMGIPPLVVGLTIVALGTSAPEAAIAITSAAQSAGDMAIAGVFGSNIVNTLVILGVTALIAEVPMRRSTMRYEVPFVLLVTTALLALGIHDGELGRADSLLLLTLLAGYVMYLVRMARSTDELNEEPAEGRAPSNVRSTGWSCYAWRAPHPFAWALSLRWMAPRQLRRLWACPSAWWD